ncbi:MAG: PaaI family thioesterase [Dethiobacter sp.]|jgi:acyl-coenzyme A thioesterase PaaI-like protein|nr:PaaI family thioesterase [Dethiobacter sp.]
MEYIVRKKQQNSKKCFVCGLKNEFGLKASFYELENNEVVAIFQPLQEHQSYPGRLHGGIAGTILDETIGRAIMTKDENLIGVTVELNLKFRKPIPLDQELKVTGMITKDSRRLFEGTGKIILPNGDIAVTGHGKYLKMSIDKMSEFDVEAQEWKITPLNKDPAIIDI